METRYERFPLIYFATGICLLHLSTVVVSLDVVANHVFQYASLTSLFVLLGLIFLPAFVSKQYYQYFSKRNIFLLIIAPLFYIATRTLIYNNLSTIIYPDSAGYMVSPFDPGRARSVTIPLFYNLFLGNNTELIKLFQYFYSTVSWIVLAISLYILIKDKWLSLIVPVVVLIMSLSHSIFQWDAIILSESLSFSLFANLVTISGWIIYHSVHAKKMKVLILSPFLVAIAFLFSNTRDSNMYLMLILAIFFVLVFWQCLKDKKLKWTLSAVFLISFVSIFFYQYHDAEEKQRWKFPLINVIFQRILTDTEATNYFVKHNMPYDEQIAGMKGQWAHSFNGVIYSNQEFQAWLDRQGVQVYQKYLLTRFFTSVITPIHELKRVFDNKEIRGYGPGGFNDVNGKRMGYLVRLIDQLVFFKISYPLFTVLIIALVLVLSAANLRQQSMVVFVTLALFSFFYVSLFVSYHGDAMEVARHSLFANYFFRLTVFMIIINIYFWVNRKIQTGMFNKRITVSGFGKG